MVDVLSGGRVNWGAGRGFDRTEFQAFDVPVAESSDRFRECVEIVLAAWRNETLTYRGQVWRYEGIEVLPKPLQTRIRRSGSPPHHPIPSGARRRRATTSSRTRTRPARTSGASASSTTTCFAR